ncbi:type I restriction-modification enzyme R subunit C-terminal domain-containing protein [Bradyrhizobium sp. 199]|uniref:type I restriction-modification enzyme R subunit C-terminal domain-containing protein n=1 Tax=Bradyrhizobium sp. 199 TaxID=2782664 RepID=UPI001FF9AD21
MSEAFGGFIAAGTATAAQIEFINMVVEHLTDQGMMEASLLYEPPSPRLRRRDQSTCSTKPGWFASSARFVRSTIAQWLERRPR